MKLTMRDLFASLLLAAIGVPYVGYLMNGEMPFVQDPRGMAAVGLILGGGAFFLVRGSNAEDRVGTTENVLAVFALVIGLVALAFAETAAAEVLLAVFMGSILVVWATEVADHAGWVRGHAETPSHV